MSTAVRLAQVERQPRRLKRFGALAIGVMVVGGHLGCAREQAPDDSADARVLSIRWQRLVDEDQQTCSRCQDTELELGEAVARLEETLASANVRIDLQKVAIDKATFERDPLASNRIWIAERPLEDWLAASVGTSQCGESCGGAECRTVRVGEEVYEAVSADLIVRAGLRAAATFTSDAEEE
ncbi:MAG: DUF2703 domain-containing protein [Planctomycetota bacterium]|jgi:hypothetical protein